jgi:hypothetical protein
VSAVGNVTGNWILGSNVSTGGIITATGTITGGNIATGGTVSATGTITGGNIATGGTVSATGNITGGNVNGGANVFATIHTGTTVSVTGAVQSANVAAGNVQATSRLIIPTAASDPASPVAGQLYYNTAGGNLRIWTGTVWDAV